ncbi:oxidoreductase-like domain-containing protein [Marinobacterium litorale]|uniref:oxidoreductase-like domain-containing protein n=1 Tax=Marinobacterium litorale TaxID=404770 RepID=UPI00042844A9|nr:oxidoreductase-like domain-containing protein [Marinobacterium litorale]
MLEKPTPPMEGECCESECSPCVWDTYYEEMHAWREEQARLKAQATQAGKSGDE